MARKNCFVKLEIEGEVVEEFSGPSFLWQRQQIHFHQLLNLIEAARLHRRVQAVILVIKPTAIGWGQIEEIHRLLTRFHAGGKHSYAYLEHADNKSYYLAAGAQKIYLSPATTLELVGLRLEILFFKKLLDYLGIDPEIVQIGPYKSAAEPFDRESMSEHSREMGDAILTDLQERMKELIAANRSVSTTRVQDWIDHGPHSAQRCSELGLTDGVCYEDELEKLVEKEGPGLVDLPWSKLRTGESFLRRAVTFYRPQIAYIVADGVISAGMSRSSRGGRSILGADTLKHLLREATRQKRVKAIVLRVNSPGGSALSSDLIWREIKAGQREQTARHLLRRHGRKWGLLHRYRCPEGSGRSFHADRVDRCDWRETEPRGTIHESRHQGGCRRKGKARWLHLLHTSFLRGGSAGRQGADATVL